MEENSRPKGESPNGIAMPDAAITGPGRSGSAFVYVTFLPCPFGPGYEAGIRGWEGNYDPVDGWPMAYYRLAGVAQVPAPISRYCCPQWHKTVVDRLRRNGVVFLDDASVEAYMKTEGRYWLHWFFGDTPLLRRLLWPVVKPKTPISDESERLALAAAYQGPQSFVFTRRGIVLNCGMSALCLRRRIAPGRCVCVSLSPRPMVRREALGIS
jgi:hypothetical protein